MTARADTIRALIEQYIETGHHRIIALTRGEGIMAIPKNITWTAFRYARLAQNQHQDLSSIGDTDCALIDLLTDNPGAHKAVINLLHKAQDEKDYLVITDDANNWGDAVRDALEACRPRLIVACDRLGECA